MTFDECFGYNAYAKYKAVTFSPCVSGFVCLFACFNMFLFVLLVCFNLCFVLMFLVLFMIYYVRLIFIFTFCLYVLCFAFVIFRLHCFHLSLLPSLPFLCHIKENTHGVNIEQSKKIMKKGRKSWIQWPSINLLIYLNLPFFLYRYRN